MRNGAARLDKMSVYYPRGAGWVGKIRTIVCTFLSTFHFIRTVLKNFNFSDFIRKDMNRNGVKIEDALLSFDKPVVEVQIS